MSIEQIVNEAAAMPEAQRKELIGRLLAIGRSKREEQEFKLRMAELIDDNDPSHWVTGDELRSRLAADSTAE
jgi:hypothetical protein